MTQRLAGKHALVTGAASGLGLAIARAFIAEGARVALADIAVEAGRAAATALGPAALFLEHDVTDEASWQRVLDAAARALGRLGASASAAELREALGDPAPFVRTAAAHALGRIGDRDAFDALALVAQVDDYDPAQAAAHALAAIDPRRTRDLGAREDASAHLHEAAALSELEPA
jgi:NAD(P)-dependent dehydrogenase (short-subunit alcohol dehydrogenase family)